jgi:pteridine reductase
MKNKGTALITGGAVRIGRAIALKLASLGYNIALHYNTSYNEAQQTKQNIVKKGVSCQLFECDLSDETCVFNLVTAVKRKLPGLNVLVNSASIFEKSSLADWNIDHYNSHWDVNFKAPFILTSEFAKKVSKGNIINILDTNINKESSQHLIYLLTKKSLCEFTKLSAIELAPGIRVNAIAPGVILPPPGKDGAYIKRRAQEVPLKTKGHPEQIADCAAFLIQSPYITGQVLFNDGGEHLL